MTDEGYFAGQAGNLSYANQNQTLECSREPLKLQLMRQKKEHEREVARLEELIRLLGENPSTERILELLGRR